MSLAIAGFRNFLNCDLARCCLDLRLHGDDYVREPGNAPENCVACIVFEINVCHKQFMKLDALLKKDGYGDMVLMSMDAYEQIQVENEIYAKLHEAELQVAKSTKRYTSEEILKELIQGVLLD